MATRTWRGTLSSSWGTAGNWLEGAVPTSADDVVFDASSPACTNSSVSACLTLTFSAYTNTFTNSNTLTVSGNLTYGASMSFGGSTAITVNATSTITSNGVTVTLPLTFSGTITVTLADILNLSATLTCNTTQTTLNSNSINLAGNLTVTSTASLIGSTNIKVIGTSTIATGSGGLLRNNLEIASGANTVTISGTFIYDTGTLLYTSGTVTTTSSTLYVSTSTTLNTSGITWNNVTLNAGTITLSSNLTVNGTTIIGAVTKIDGFTLNMNGNLTVSGATTSTGTTLLKFTGTSTWSGVSVLRNPIEVAGNLTLSSSGVSLRGGVSFTYTSGTFDATTNSSTFTSNDSNTFNNIGGINFYRFDFGSTTQTTTLNSNMNIVNQMTIGNSPNTINGNNIYCSGNLVLLNQLYGTTHIHLTGNGTWSTSVSYGIVNNPMTINAGANTVVISGTVYYGTDTFTYTSGTVTVSGSTFNVASTCTLAASALTFNNVTLASGTTTITTGLTVAGNLSLSGVSQVNGGTITVAGNLTNATNMNNALTSTSSITLNGTGTWSGNTRHCLPVTINTSGTITITDVNLVQGSSLTYTAGTVICTGTVRSESGSYTTTFNTNNNIAFYNLSLLNSTVTNSSELTVLKTLTLANTTISGSNINLWGDYAPTANQTGTSTAQLNFLGTGTWSGNFANRCSINIQSGSALTIDGSVSHIFGTITMNSNIVKGINTPTLNLTGSATIINAHKLNVFKTINITAGSTITLNKMFEGTATTPVKILSTTTSNYTITFQDSFPKLTKFANINNCTVTSPTQLINTYTVGTKTNNSGITSTHPMTPLNTSKDLVNVRMGYGTMAVADPNMIKL